MAPGVRCCGWPGSDPLQLKAEEISLALLDAFPDALTLDGCDVRITHACDVDVDPLLDTIAASDLDVIAAPIGRGESGRGPDQPTRQPGFCTE